MSERAAIVTGASGFVGQRLLLALQRESWSVKAVGRVEWETLESMNVRGDEVVFHLAAHVPKAMEDASEAKACLEANALLTLKLIEWMRAHQGMKLVHASTGQIYGWQAQPVTEDTPVSVTRRACFYLSSKVLAETYIARAVELHGLQAVVLRIASVYGPGMKAGSLVAFFRSQAEQGKPLPLRNGGEEVFDLVHVDDVVQCLIAAARPEVRGVFHAGSGVPICVAEVARVVNEVCGNAAGVVMVPSDGKPAQPGFAALDMTKSRAVLGVNPRTLSEGLRS